MDLENMQITEQQFNEKQERVIPESEKNLASYFMLEIEQKDREGDIGIKFIFEPTPMEIEGPMTDVMLMGLAVCNVVNGYKKEIEAEIARELEQLKNNE